jgi:hypothetical protein
MRGLFLAASCLAAMALAGCNGEPSRPPAVQVSVPTNSVRCSLSGADGCKALFEKAAQELCANLKYAKGRPANVVHGGAANPQTYVLTAIACE